MFDLDVWIKCSEGVYDYIGDNDDDILVISKDPPSIFEKLK